MGILKGQGAQSYVKEQIRKRADPEAKVVPVIPETIEPKEIQQFFMHQRLEGFRAALEDQGYAYDGIVAEGELQRDRIFYEAMGTMLQVEAADLFGRSKKPDAAFDKDLQRFVDAKHALKVMSKGSGDVDVDPGTEMRALTASLKPAPFDLPREAQLPLPSDLPPARDRPQK